MAAPKDSPEQAYRLRKFQGTGTEIDSTFLGPSFVSRSQNWIPTQSFRLGKRPGTVLLQRVGAGTQAVTNLLPVHALDSSLYLYAYSVTASGGQVCQSVNEGAYSVVPGATTAVLPSTNPGRVVAFRDHLYAGNGVDPLLTWKIGDTTAAASLGPINADGASPAAGTATIDPTSPNAIPTGTYSYCWGRFNTVTGFYTGRSDPATVTVAPNTVSLPFPIPAHALGTNEVWRLFVSPRNYPIEYSTMQVDNVTTGSATIQTIDVTDQRCPLAGGTLTLGNYRTGNILLVWQNRLVFSGRVTNPYAIYATDTILPGTEQSAFNLGTMFPVDAKVMLPGRVTGIGMAGVSTDYQAGAPLLFFTESKTFLISGDPFLSSIELDAGATPATMEEISSRVGCVSHDTIVNTPAGTIFVGIDSVYVIPPGGGYPQDIGWPIADQIRAIPTAQRQSLCACFHKQFYKLAMGQAGNTQQWWLDLRQGLTGTPSWWGPHALGQNPVTGMAAYAVSAMCADPSSTLEVDRGYLAVDATDQILLHHQLGLFSDYDPTGEVPIGIGVYSVLVGGRFDGDQPFIAKVMTRLRLISQTTAKSQIDVTVVVDNGASTVLDPILLGEDMDPAGQFVHLTPFPDPPYPPNNQQWNLATFATVSPAEAQTIAPYKRPRFLSIQAVLTHGPEPIEDPSQPGTVMTPVPGVELRDFELLFIPSERKVRYTSDQSRAVPNYGPERVST